LDNLKERYHLGDLYVDERIVLKWTLEETGCKSVVWIQLDHDRHSW